MKNQKFNKTTARFFRDFVENYFQGQGIQVVYWPMTFHEVEDTYYQSARCENKSFLFYFYPKNGIIDLYTTNIKLKSDEDFECIEILSWRQFIHSWKVNEKAYQSPANCGTVEPQSNCETI